MRAIIYRGLDSADFQRLGDIDRTDRIEAIYIQNGETLEESSQPFDVPPWSPSGDDAHSVPDQIGYIEWHASRGANVFGAFDGDRLVGIGVITPHIRPGIAPS